MASQLCDLLHKEIKQMIIGIGVQGKGNIYPLIVGEMERYVIHLVLEETRFNLFLAAKMLGISRSTLYRKIERLNIKLGEIQE